MGEHRTYKVDMLTRVEGEGRFFLQVDDRGQVTDARLTIFEAPRFFEAFLRGRSLFEVPDIVARICGICPVAYQMSGVRALENALEFAPNPLVRKLRRLLYCGEWIESHALHVFLLHAPDFLGYPSAIAMAVDHKPLVERGLRMKKTGNQLIEILGGRAIHPISVRVGGFTRKPDRKALRQLCAALEQSLDEAEETVAWTRTLPMPAFSPPGGYTFVSLIGADYPLEWGDEIAISGRGRIPVTDFAEHFEESHVEHSNALHCRLRDGTSYLCGPMARINLCADTLHPRARRALDKSGLALPVVNPYESITVRAVELVHAFAEALDIIRSIDTAHGDERALLASQRAFDEPAVRAGIGHGASEAPRGLLYHRYRFDNDGLIEDATIIPPTSQNQARIEDDLVGIAPDLLALDNQPATALCEQLIRSYDPCISCATHFLRLDVERLAPTDRTPQPEPDREVE